MGKWSPISDIKFSRKARRKEVVMATASITKQFVIKDDSVCQRLIDEMNNPNRKKRKRKTDPDAYEKGKKILKQFSYR